jgi:hypothetical protein
MKDNKPAIKAKQSSAVLQVRQAWTAKHDRLLIAGTCVEWFSVDTRCLIANPVSNRHDN